MLSIRNYSVGIDFGESREWETHPKHSTAFGGGSNLGNSVVLDFPSLKDENHRPIDLEGMIFTNS